MTLFLRDPKRLTPWIAPLCHDSSAEFKEFRLISILCGPINTAWSDRLIDLLHSFVKYCLWKKALISVLTVYNANEAKPNQGTNDLAGAMFSPPRARWLQLHERPCFLSSPPFVWARLRCSWDEIKPRVIWIPNSSTSTFDVLRDASRHQYF